MRKHKRKFIFFLVLLVILICCSSCNSCGLLFYLNESDEHKQMRENGYELCHIQSCGPEALQYAFNDLGIEKDFVQIAKEIQDSDRVHYRTVLSVVDHGFTRITCPPELVKYCRSQGLSVTKIKYSELKDNDVAIVLLRGKSDIRDWHWMAWPKHTREEIENFFEEDTKVLSAYLLEK